MKLKLFNQGQYLVKITNPFRFDRCGYPLTLGLAKTALPFSIRHSIRSMIDDCCDGIVTKPIKDTAYEKIMAELAHVYQHSVGFNGKERSIYNHHEPLMENMIAYAFEYGFVVTGTRHPGSRDPDEPESPRLENARRHKIISVHPVTSIERNACTTSGWSIGVRCWLDDDQDYAPILIQDEYTAKITYDEALEIMELKQKK